MNYIRRTENYIHGYPDVSRHQTSPHADISHHNMRKCSNICSRDEIQALIEDCSHSKDLRLGRSIYLSAVSNGFDSVSDLGDYLIRMFTSCGSLLDADIIFCKIAKPTSYSWHAIMSAHALLGKGQTTISLFHSLQKNGFKPSKFIFLSLLRAIRTMKCLPEGRLAHSQILLSGFESDVVVLSMVIDMYAKCGSIDEAHKVFETSSNLNVISWNSMIAGLVQRQDNTRAFALFLKMEKAGIQPSKYTFSCVLNVCNHVNQGMQIHHQIITSRLESDVVVGTALVAMYANCRRVVEAHKAFHNVINPDLGAWNAVIVGYSQHDYGHSALEMFREMIKQCIEPDKITFSSIVKACTSIGAIETGKLVHNELLSQRLELDLIIGNSLIDMYARCGSLQEAHKILMKLSNRDIVSWNILISMYAQQGDCRLVQQYFYEMIKEGIKPDERTFMSILAACSHAGHVDEGRDFFISMVEDFGVIQGPEHFNCMIDLLGRVGKLKDAECFLASMPASPSSFTGWTSLLAACDKYSGTGIGRESFHRLSVIDPLCASGYVLMSNIYARIDKVRDVSKLHYSGKHD